MWNIDAKDHTHHRIFHPPPSRGRVCFDFSEELAAGFVAVAFAIGVSTAQKIADYLKLVRMELPARLTGTREKPRFAEYENKLQGSLIQSQSQCVTALGDGGKITTGFRMVDKPPILEVKVCANLNGPGNGIHLDGIKQPHISCRVAVSDHSPTDNCDSIQNRTSKCRRPSFGKADHKHDSGNDRSHADTTNLQAFLIQPAQFSRCAAFGPLLRSEPQCRPQGLFQPYREFPEAGAGRLSKAARRPLQARRPPHHAAPSIGSSRIAGHSPHVRRSICENDLHAVAANALDCENRGAGRVHNANGFALAEPKAWWPENPVQGFCQFWKWKATVADNARARKRYYRAHVYPRVWCALFCRLKSVERVS